MYRIDHKDAIVLEHMVRRMYGCDRFGISGLADADYFERNPIQAAVLVVACIYAKEWERNSNKYEQFLSNYETFFDSSDETDVEEKVQQYIKELQAIVDSCLE